MTQSDSIYQSGEYLENNPDWHAADAPFKARWINNILDDNKIHADSITEIGCGSGEILVELKKIYPDTQFNGYDISSQAYQICSKKASDGLSFHQADLLSLQTPPDDVLLAIDVFEHVDDYMSFIRAMKDRAIWKLFHIPLDLSVQGLLRGKPIMYSRNVVGHLHYFYKDTALAVLKDCGLEVVDWNYTHGAESLPNRKLRTKILNLPRKIFRAINQDLAVRVLGGASIMVLTR
jgi:SAM-dependent methyltransferase